MTLSSDGKIATLDPSANLSSRTSYKLTVKGGAGGVKDYPAKNSLAADKSWSFKPAR